MLYILQNFFQNRFSGFVTVFEFNSRIMVRVNSSGLGKICCCIEISTFGIFCKLKKKNNWRRKLKFFSETEILLWNWKLPLKFVENKFQRNYLLPNHNPWHEILIKNKIHHRKDRSPKKKKYFQALFLQIKLRIIKIWRISAVYSNSTDRITILDEHLPKP